MDEDDYEDVIEGMEDTIHDLSERVEVLEDALKRLTYRIDAAESAPSGKGGADDERD